MYFSNYSPSLVDVVIVLLRGSFSFSLIFNVQDPRELNDMSKIYTVLFCFNAFASSIDPFPLILFQCKMRERIFKSGFTSNEERLMAEVHVREHFEKLSTEIVGRVIKSEQKSSQHGSPISFSSRFRWVSIGGYLLKELHKRL